MISLYKLEHDLTRTDVSLCLEYDFTVYPIPRADKRIYLEMNRKGRKKRLAEIYEQDEAMSRKIQDLYRQEAFKIRIILTHNIKNLKNEKTA